MAKQTLLAAKTRLKKISELTPQQRNSRQSKHSHGKTKRTHTNTRHNNETHSKINSTLGKWQTQVKTKQCQLAAKQNEHNKDWKKLTAKQTEVTEKRNELLAQQQYSRQKNSTQGKTNSLTCYPSRTTFEAKPGRTRISRTLLKALPPSLFLETNSPSK